jgi:hypothetical protein
MLALTIKEWKLTLAAASLLVAIGISLWAIHLNDLRRQAEKSALLAEANNRVNLQMLSIYRKMEAERSAALEELSGQRAGHETDVDKIAASP